MATGDSDENPDAHSGGAPAAPEQAEPSSRLADTSLLDKEADANDEQADLNRSSAEGHSKIATGTAASHQDVPAHRPSQHAFDTRMAELPPLAAMGTAGALLHLVLQRVALPIWLQQGYVVPTWLSVLPRLTLNLTAISVLLCLSWTLVQLVGDYRYSHYSRRTLIAILGAGSVALGTAALFLQEGRFSTQAIMLGAAVTHMMAVQLAMAGLRSHESLAGRTTAVLAATTSLLAVVSMLLRQLIPLSPAFVSRDGVATLHGLGELAYLVTPIACAFVVVPWDDTNAGRRARAAGAVATFGTGLLFAAASQLPHEEYGHLLYAILRLEWALEQASLGYAVPVSLAVGAASAAMLSQDRRQRQGGMALWLWLCAGYNPLSPARLLWWGLSAALLSRALVSLRQQRGGTPLRT